MGFPGVSPRKADLRYTGAVDGARRKDPARGEEWPLSRSAGRRSAQLTLPPNATSPARARRFVTSTLAAWRVESSGDDLLLLASELVTNALLHARTPMTIRLDDEGDDVVRLAVIDGSPLGIQQRRFSVESGTGRGLRLLDAVALDWGVRHGRNGKTVWCLVSLSAEASYGTFDVDAVEAL